MSSHKMTQAGSLADRITLARQASGMTKRQLAAITNVSESYVVRLEQGNREPSRVVVDALARGLNVRRDWLAKGQGPMERADDSVIAAGHETVQRRGTASGNAQLLTQIASRLEKRLPSGIDRLPRRYVNRYVARLLDIRARVEDKLRRQLLEIDAEVARELTDLEERLRAEWRAEDRRRPRARRHRAD